MFSPEQRGLCEAQPVRRVQYFASLLGWYDLRPDFFLDSFEHKPGPNFPLGVMLLYRTTDARFNLQVTARLAQGPDEYALFNRCPRFGFDSVGPAEFTLFPDD